MKSIGVKITPVPSDFPGIMKRLLSKKFDMTSWLIPGAYDMEPITTAVLHSKSPWNMSGYANEQMDRTLGELRMITDPNKRKEIMCGIARKVNAEVPFLFMFGRTYSLFAKNAVQNIKLPVFGEEILNFSEAWMVQ